MIGSRSPKAGIIPTNPAAKGIVPMNRIMGKVIRLLSSTNLSRQRLSARQHSLGVSNVGVRVGIQGSLSALIAKTSCPNKYVVKNTERLRRGHRDEDSDAHANPSLEGLSK